MRLDPGQACTEKTVREMRKKIEKVYSKAAGDLQKKFLRHMKRFTAQDAQKRRDMAAGRITKEQYDSWKMGQVFTGKAWQNRIGTAAGVLTDLNRRAMDIITRGIRRIFGVNMDYQHYSVEHDIGVDTGFSIHNPEAVDRLIAEDPSVLPKWKIDEEKDYVWNAKKVNDIITQGIIQGESVEQMAEHLAKELKTVNMNKMRMFARTAATNAQNAGRIEAMRKQKELGIDIQKKWMAAHDTRTRDAHRLLDGQTADVDAPFILKMTGQKIRYPGDAQAPPALVYNCRCTLGYHYPQLQKRLDQKKLAQMGKSDAPGLSFDQWLEQKENVERSRELNRRR